MSRSWRRILGPPRTRPSAAVALGWLLFGMLFGAAVLAFGVSPYWRLSREGIPRTCVVLDKRIGVSTGKNGGTYRPELRVSYEVDGVTHDIWSTTATEVYSSGRAAKQATLDGFEVGR